MFSFWVNRRLDIGSISLFIKAYNYLYSIFDNYRAGFPIQFTGWLCTAVYRERDLFKRRIWGESDISSDLDQFRYNDRYYFIGGFSNCSGGWYCQNNSISRRDNQPAGKLTGSSIFIDYFHNLNHHGYNNRFCDFNRYDYRDYNHNHDTLELTGCYGKR